MKAKIIITGRPLINKKRKVGKMMSLDGFLRQLISEKENVRPEAITCEFLSKRRKEHPFPPDPSSVSQYGGYITDGLIFISDDQFKEEESLFDKFLEHF